MNLYETVTNTIVAALDRGVVPWRKPWDTSASIPMNAGTNRPYRGVNVLLLSMSQYQDYRWLTFRQVKERGGSVRSGERSTLVVFWKRWQPPSDEHDEHSTTRSIPLLRYYRVFNVEQCKGLDLPQTINEPQICTYERLARADALVKGMLDPPTISEDGWSAWYRPKDDHVQVPPMALFPSRDAFYATLFHELGHATGHQNRLARPGVTGDIRFGSGEYSREELVAELTSAFCCAALSLDNSLIEDAASYISNWLRILKADNKAVVVAAAQAQRAAEYILGISHTE